jgi:hypothetical protein
LADIPDFFSLDFRDKTRFLWKDFPQVGGGI